MLPDKTMMYKEFNKTRIIDAEKAVKIFKICWHWKMKSTEKKSISMSCIWITNAE